MKFLLLLIVILALGAGGYVYFSAPGPSPSPAQPAANTDARPLTPAEQTAFLPLVCGGAGPGSDGYAHNCTSLPGYPSSDYGGAGTGLGITLTSIITGHFSSATGAETYVSYQGSFEPHVNEFGGGILFAADGKGGWTLKRWLPGGNMDGCLALNPQGRSKMLCISGSTGQGETDTLLSLITIPDTSGTALLHATDYAGTDQPGSVCSLQKAPGQDVLLDIDSISRTAANSYAVRIGYEAAAAAAAACKAQNPGSAPPVTKATLTLGWDGSAASITPARKFAPAA